MLWSRDKHKSPAQHEIEAGLHRLNTVLADVTPALFDSTLVLDAKAKVALEIIQWARSAKMRPNHLEAYMQWYSAITAKIATCREQHSAYEIRQEARRSGDRIPLPDGNPSIAVSMAVQELSEEK